VSRRLRCLLLGHSWRASVTAGGRAVLVSCNRGCSIGPDLVPIAKAQHASLLPPTRPAASVLYDVWSGRPLDQTVTVDTADIFAVALVLVGVAAKGEDPRALLDVLTLAHLDPDRGAS
jgi:hypothetical protein